MWDVVWRQASIQLPDGAPTLLKMSLCLSQLQQSHILASRFEAVPSGLSVSLRICQLSLVCADRVRGIIKYFCRIELPKRGNILYNRLGRCVEALEATEEPYRIP